MECAREFTMVWKWKYLYDLTIVAGDAKSLQKFARTASEALNVRSWILNTTPQPTQHCRGTAPRQSHGVIFWQFFVIFGPPVARIKNEKHLLVSCQQHHIGFVENLWGLHGLPLLVYWRHWYFCIMVRHLRWKTSVVPIRPSITWNSSFCSTAWYMLPQ